MRLLPMFLILCESISAAPLLPAEDLAWLRELTVAVIDASRVAPGASVGQYGPNTSGGMLIRPGGRDAYPAFWIRDYAMSLDCGIIPASEQRHMLIHTAAYQQDEPVELKTGSVLPPGSVPDHVSFDGKPIFFPGILDDYENQGGSRWGKLPCLDDQFFFIHMAAEYVRQTQDKSILAEVVDGMSLFARLEAAYRMPPSRENGLVFATDAERGVNFGFFDTTVHTGDLLFASLLKWRAALQLADLAADSEQATAYHAEANRIVKAIGETFAREDGWLRASTGTSGQPDVWGTAFAVSLGVLNAEHELAAAKTLAQAYDAGTIAWHGQIRHVPTDLDFSEASAWETSYAAKNTYQNGAYWATPTGWVCAAIAQVDEAAARRLAGEYIAALRAEDFRQGEEFGAPWECMHPQRDHRQNPLYMTSVTLPLAVFVKMD